MISAEFLSSPWFAYIILPLLIFMARIVDVSLGTLRLIFVSKGYKYTAPLIGFVEILVWIIAISQIIKNLSNPVCYIAYAGGFAMGNYVGMIINERLSLGMVMIRIVTRFKAEKLIEALRDSGYGCTTVDAQGAYGPVKVLFTIASRKQSGKIIAIVRDFNPQAVYTLEDLEFAERAVMPVLPPNKFTFWRAFRKGK